MSTVLTRIAENGAREVVEAKRINAGNRKIGLILKIDRGGYDFMSVELTKKQSIELALKIIEGMTEFD